MLHVAQLIVNVSLASLAVWQAVDVYKTSELFSDVRDLVDMGYFGSFVQKLTDCKWCLSIQTSLIVMFWLTTMPSWLAWPVYGLAVSKMANLLHDKFREGDDLDGE